MEHSYSFSKEKEVEGYVSCPICNRFCSKNGLKLHINNQHNKVKEFKCSHCCLQALSSLSILRHIRSYHPGKEETIFKLPEETINSAVDQNREPQNLLKKDKSPNKDLLKSSLENKRREEKNNHSENEDLVVGREPFHENYTDTDSDTSIKQNSNNEQDVPVSPQQSSVITSESVILIDNLGSNPTVAPESEVYTTINDNTEDNKTADKSIDDNISQEGSFCHDSNTIDKTVDDNMIINRKEVQKGTLNEKGTITKVERKSKFSKKLSSGELNNLLKIKSKCGLCGILISDRFVERHLENKHDIIFVRQNNSSQQVCDTQVKESTKEINSSIDGSNISKSVAYIQQQQQQTTAKQQHLIERQQPLEIKRKLCMLKVAKGHKMCGKCGQVYLKLKIHRKNCTG